MKTELHSAVEASNYHLCAIILENSKEIINEQDEVGETALNLAAKTNNFQICNLLLEAGSDVNLANNSGTTPLHRSAENGNKFLLNIFLLHNALILRDLDGSTAFHIAALSNRLEICKALIKHNENIINDVNECGVAAIHLASLHEDGKIYQFLYDRNAISQIATKKEFRYKDIVIKAGSTPLDLMNITSKKIGEEKSPFADHIFFLQRNSEYEESKETRSRLEEENKKQEALKKEQLEREEKGKAAQRQKERDLRREAIAKEKEQEQRKEEESKRKMYEGIEKRRLEREAKKRAEEIEEKIREEIRRKNFQARQERDARRKEENPKAQPTPQASSSSKADIPSSNPNPTEYNNVSLINRIIEIDAFAKNQLKKLETEINPRSYAYEVRESQIMLSSAKEVLKTLTETTGKTLKIALLKIHPDKNLENSGNASAATRIVLDAKELVEKSREVAG
jgi:hypothetical protein